MYKLTYIHRHIHYLHYVFLNNVYSLFLQNSSVANLSVDKVSHYSYKVHSVVMKLNCKKSDTGIYV